MRFSILLAAAAVALATSAHGADTNDCDRLAAHPLDPDRKGQGLYLDQVDGAAAEAACRAAIAASPGEPRFVYQLARALDQQGRTDDAEATYRQAMEAGYRMATYSYGAFLQDKATDESYRLAAQYYQRALTAGLGFAAGDLGYLYEAGLGVPADSLKAIALYRQAGDGGDAWSINHIGAIYDGGIGVPKDDAEAIKWYRAASDLGFAPAQYNLGKFYLDGRGGVTRDATEGARLLKLAADQDDPPSLRALAGLYAAGTGVAADKAAAERLLRHEIDIASDDELWQAKNSLAWLLAQQGSKLDEAQGLAEAALAAAPPDHEDYDNLQDTLAWITHLRGDDEKARAIEAEALASDPASPLLHDHMGDILKGLGDAAGARAEWQKALNLPQRPNDPDPLDRTATEAKLAAEG